MCVVRGVGTDIIQILFFDVDYGTELVLCVISGLILKHKYSAVLWVCFIEDVKYESVRCRLFQFSFRRLTPDNRKVLYFANSNFVRFVYST